MSGIRFLSAAVVFGAMVSSHAFAADMQMPPQAPPLGAQERQEFGTGWYLRGDISWAREKAPVVFPDGSLGQSAKLGNNYSMSVGGGYKFNNWFRTDLTWDYFKQLNTNLTSAPFTCYDEVRIVNNPAGDPVGVHAVPNQCRSTQAARLNRYALLANAYLDLGSWGGISPYVGAGVGTSYGRTTGAYDWVYNANGTHYGPTLTLPGNAPIPTVWFDNNGNIVPAPVTSFGTQNKSTTINRRTFNIAWALMAGVAYDVSPNAKIDLGYRYLNLGKFGAGTKSATVSEYRIGFRYMID